MKWVKVSDIIINEPFASSVPKKQKLNRIRAYYNEYRCVDKPLTVNRNNILLDGYIRYLVLKENNVMYTKVKVVKYIPKKKKGDNYELAVV